MSADGTTPVVVDYVRSAIGRAHKGSLAQVRPDDLAAHVVGELVKRFPPLGGELPIDDVVCGCAFPWGEQGYNLGRCISVLSGLDHAVPGQTITRLCASSMQALRSAAHAILAGEGETFIVVGVESVSRVGRGTELAPLNPLLDPASPAPTLGDVFLPMGMTAENVADRYGVSRDEMDRFALLSHERATAAQEAGIFDREIVPLVVDGKPFQRDEGPRPDSSLEALHALKPAFKENGCVTAGNSCSLNDGAIAALVMSERAARAAGFAPRARVLGSAVSGVDPSMMGIGPIPANERLLRAQGLSADDLEIIELNEAFAAQVLPVCHAMDVDPFGDRLNPYGGGIALGHPFGMTGLRLVGSLINGLERRDGRLGLATLCVGGGQGQSMLLERLPA